VAAAVGQPDSYAGELPVVFVSLVPGADIDEATLLAFAAGRVPEPAAQPKQVWILPELPLTPVGKIFKPTLRAHATSHAIRAALERLRPPQAAEIEVADGGGRAIVRIAGLDAATEARVRAALAGMPIQIGIEAAPCS
jgi:fatty-acyl-CoA synthase